MDLNGWFRVFATGSAVALGCHLLRKSAFSKIRAIVRETQGDITSTTNLRQIERFADDSALYASKNGLPNHGRDIQSWRREFAALADKKRIQGNASPTRECPLTSISIARIVAGLLLAIPFVYWFADPGQPSSLWTDLTKAKRAQAVIVAQPAPDFPDRNASNKNQGTENVRSFIQQRLVNENGRDITRILQDYADEVIYFDNGKVSAEFIGKDKAAYYARWPESHEEVIGPIEVQSTESGWEATFRTSFRVSSRERGVEIKGTQESRYVVQLLNGRFQILLEQGKVLSRDTRNFTRSQPSVKDNGSALPGERFPQTRMRQLDERDIDGWSVDSLRYAINEMFARHGAEFHQADLNAYFRRFAWYRPRAGISFDNIEQEFSGIEKDNIKLLGTMRDRKKESSNN